MHDKMAETKKGVVLFHETLKALNIKHEILSFSEDAFDSDEHAQPNIINEIINYDYSTFEKMAHVLWHLNLKMIIVMVLLLELQVND